MIESIDVEAVAEGTFILTVVGSISFNANQKFKEGLNGVLAQSPDRLLIDLSKVSFCNSQGFGDLLWAYTSLAKAHGSFGLIAPSPEIRKLLEITKFATVIDVFPSRSAALER